jgi:hypothetical protein
VHDPSSSEHQERLKMDWKTTLPTCFGSDDLVLGSHAQDEKRARIMIAEARGTGSTDGDIRNAVRSYLRSRGTRSDDVAEQNAHIATQMEKLEEYLADA